MFIHLFKGQLSKETFVQANVQETVFQGNFGPRGLLFKEAFTSDKLTQIILFGKLQSSLIVQSTSVGLGLDFVFPPSQQVTTSNNNK